ncbi:MAG: gamma-glutamyl-phosphate reductase, partial [Hoeflea sp.]
MLDKTDSQANIAELMAEIGRRAKAAARPLAIAGPEKKNAALEAMASAIDAGRQSILEANRTDVEAAVAGGMATSFVDRLKLDDARIDGIIGGIRAIAALKDPVGDVIAAWDRPNGLKIERVRTPLG